MGAMRREVARRHGAEAAEAIRVHTKLVPDPRRAADHLPR